VATHENSVETTATPERVWALWSDPATWPSWNPDVESMTLNGPFQPGTTGVMKTRAGRTHQMLLAAVEPGHSFHLETSVIPGTRFTFICRVTPGSGGATISQAIDMRGPLAPIVSPLAGGGIAKGFGPLLEGLKKAAESGG